MKHWLVITLLLVGCATPPPSMDTRNAAGFAAKLRARDVMSAARFALYFQWSAESPELMAQYYMMTCQPRRALAATERIVDSVRRRLFLATLAALTSVERPSNARSPISEDADRQSGEVALVYPVDGGEIWRDEWPELRVAPAQSCPGMPVIRDVGLRAEFQAKARALFETLPPDVFRLDWNLVALALDVGMVPPGSEELLSRYHDRARDPYYARLEAVAHRVSDPVPLASRQARGSVIDLTELKLVELVEVPHPIDTPLLLGSRAAR